MEGDQIAPALRVLVLEDRPEDAALTLHELRRSGMKPKSRIVATEADYRKALDDPWDVILADYRLPGFNALAALDILKERKLETPFLVLTATLSDEAAAECLKRGAIDYLLKDRLARLGPAIEQALGQRRLKGEKRTVERELIDTEKRLRRLIERTRVVSYDWRIVDDRFVAVGAQAAEFLNTTTDAWLAPGFRAQRVHPDDRERVDNFLRHAARTGEDFELEYRLVAEGGNIVWVRDVATFGPDAPDGIVPGFLFDITESKKRDQQLAQAQKMEAIGQLTGGVAHDFNNILGVVIGNLDQQIHLIETQADQPTLREKTKELGEAALGAALRGADLVKHLLAFSRNQPLQPKLLDLGKLATDLAPLLRRAVGDGIAVEFRLEKNLWSVMADPGQFENALLNLAINARDAMPQGGRIQITTANATIDETAAMAGDLPVGEFTTVAVTDSGTGIPPEILAKVFEPFFTTKPTGKGTGLGLSMVFGYARQSGGSAKIYSEVGLGTEVRLYLPRAIAAGAADTRQSEGAAPAAARNARILVVEDKPDMRATAISLLESLGYRPTGAEDAAAALDVLKGSERFDLLFTDLAMPGTMNGVGLANEARGRFPDLPIVFTTGFSDPEMLRTEAVRLGASILGKPYRKVELAKHIHDALAAAPASPA